MRGENRKVGFINCALFLGRRLVDFLSRLYMLGFLLCSSISISFTVSIIGLSGLPYHDFNYIYGA
jgi:hypothetical protein